MSVEGPLRDGNPAGFQLIETMRWEPDRGLVRLDRHLGRLERSAGLLGFTFDRSAIFGRLAATATGETPLRIRLALKRDGCFDIAAHPFHALQSDTVWRLRIAQTRLFSNEPMARHKTTLRSDYENARAEFAPHEADEVILLNEKDEICEGTITNVFVRRGDGILVTPPIGCGLLPGILREELLARGEAVEDVLKPDDLDGAGELLVGNSLRGLIRASLS